MSSQVSFRYSQDELLIEACPTVNSHIPDCESRSNTCFWRQCRHSIVLASINRLSVIVDLDNSKGEKNRSMICARVCKFNFYIIFLQLVKLNDVAGGLLCEIEE